MASPPRIRTPLVQQWHRFRQQVLPVLCFFACAVTTLILWQRQARIGNGIGQIHAARGDVATGAAGLLVSQTPVPPTLELNLPAEPTHASDHGEYIVSYVRQSHRFCPQKGMKVKLRTRLPGSRSFESEVEHVASQYEQVPQQQLADPMTPEWGLPVRIRMPAQLDSLPGAILDVSFPPTHHQTSQ